MNKPRTLLALSLLLLSLCAGAQSRSEKNLYEKTLKYFSVKSADKFLQKYPQSVFAPRVQVMKDSLMLNEFLAADACTFSLDEDLTLHILSPDGALERTRVLPRYTLEEAPGALSLALPLEIIAPLGGRNYLHFGYRNGASEYVEVLYLPREDIQHQVLFYGTPLSGGRIEGQCPEMMEGLSPSAEVAWLVERLKENPALVSISRADMLTDASIRWWLEKNPKAETTASKLSFGRLDSESSLVEACKKAAKEKGKGVSVAKVDIRGYTVLCALKGGEYSLIWCEKQCRNRKTDKYIRSFFFESDGTTLDVVYYKGNTTFKNKISLTTQALRHLK